MSSIYSEQIGDGTSVILIHGYCETSQIWKPLVKKLAFSHQVTIMDLPGFGKSPLPEYPFSIADIAELVHQWIIAKDLQNSILIGHSLGGYVTLALAEKYPDSLKGFGLFHSTAFADDEEKKHSRNKTIDFVKKRGVKVFADSFVSQLFYSRNRKRLEKEIQQVTVTAAETSEKTLVKYMEAMRDRPDRTNVLKTFEKPILFIAGDQDGSVPIEKSRAQYEMMNQPIIAELKDVGHMGMYEATVESFEVIHTFLSSFEINDLPEAENLGILPDRDLKKNLGCG